MPAPDFATAAPLHTDADVLARVHDIVGPAVAHHQLWIMLVDGDGRQSPVIVPISPVPPAPAALVTGLTTVLAGLRDDLATAAGPGSVVLTLERHGPDAVLPSDRAWADTLAGACAGAGLALRGFHVSTPGGVARVPESAA
ncbi:MAG: hypothetical protein ACT4RN_06885 [Pseudonocardia sp.]